MWNKKERDKINNRMKEGEAKDKGIRRVIGVKRDKKAKDKYREKKERDKDKHNPRKERYKNKRINRII